MANKETCAMCRWPLPLDMRWAAPPGLEMPGDRDLCRLCEHTMRAYCFEPHTSPWIRAAHVNFMTNLVLYKLSGVRERVDDVPRRCSF